MATAFLQGNQVPFEYALDGRNVQRFRPFPNVNGTIPIVDSTGTSSYHAVNFKLEKRFASGLNFLVNHTVQKNMETNGTGPSSFTQNGGTSFVFDNYNLSRERAAAPIDVPQIFVASYGYELPWMKSNRLVGGWQTNGITIVRGCFPSDLRTNVLAPIFKTFNMPDRVAGQPTQIQENRSVDGFFNPGAFKVSGTARSVSGANIQLLGDSAACGARARIGQPRFFSLQEHANHRALHLAVPRRVLQPDQHADIFPALGLGAVHDVYWPGGGGLQRGEPHLWNTL